MGKVKIKKNDVWIDMTPMSDVMVLLLTFFMLTSTFVKNEAVKVVTPGSVTEAKVPTADVLNITVNPEGQVFMSMDKTSDLVAALDEMCDLFGVQLSAEQRTKFRDDPQFGISMTKLPTYLTLPREKMSEGLKLGGGIPTDSIGDGEEKDMSEFQHWVKAAKRNNPDLKLCIKADVTTPYSSIKKVMSELQDMSENRYQLLTSYKKAEE